MCALGGIRTPNLLIRRRRGSGPPARWCGRADLRLRTPEPPARGYCPQHYWIRQALAEVSEEEEKRVLLAATSFICTTTFSRTPPSGTAYSTSLDVFCVHQSRAYPKTPLSRLPGSAYNRPLRFLLKRAIATSTWSKKLANKYGRREEAEDISRRASSRI
jgi:hypothetical protein